MITLALITGGAGGIGSATAVKFAQAGMTVVLADLNLEAAVNAASALPGAGHSGVALDVTDEEAVVSAFADIEARIGPIAVLAHFAGALEGAGPAANISIADITTASWKRVFDVNALGTFLCVREYVRHRKARPVQHGRILTVSSLAGQMGGTKARVGYAASKAAVIGLTKNVARELASSGITVNCLAPGAIDTQMFRQAAGEPRTGDVSHHAGNIPMGRIGLPEEIAATALFLVSPDAAFITGQVVAVNGGQYM